MTEVPATSAGTSSEDVAEFAPMFRTMYAHVVNPRAYRSWQGYDDFEPEDAPALSRPIGGVIRGIATFERDAVQLVGIAGSKTRRVNFRLSSYLGDPDKNAASWQELIQSTLTAKRLDESQRTAVDLQWADRILSFAREHLEKSPRPTAVLDYSEADWEVGIKPHWSLDCDVPPIVLAELMADVQAGRCKRISLMLGFEPTLGNDKYAPASCPVTWGVLGTSFGWVKHVSWSDVIEDDEDLLVVHDGATEGDRGILDAYREHEEDELSWAPPPLPAATAVDDIKHLSATVRRGFVLTLIAIVLVALLT